LCGLIIFLEDGQPACPVFIARWWTSIFNCGDLSNKLPPEIISE
jgi:hypothetical protein